MFQKLLRTNDDPTLALLRVVLGVVFLAHGAQKVLGWFGGNGYTATMHFFTENMHIPAIFAFLAICAEFLGGIGLIVGLLGRVAAFGIAVNMIVAIVMVHLPHGFFMNWTGTQKGEGIEYHLLTLATCAAIMVHGSGAWSLDRLLSSGTRLASGRWSVPRPRPSGI
jgi:putative oxidoreductase